MVSKRDQNNMRDYIFASLEGAHLKIEPRSKELISGIKSHYLVLDDNGIVILVDRVYPGETLPNLMRLVKEARPNVGAVLFKDGETFFRSAAEDKRFKKDQGLSLKNYSDDKIHRMMLLRPEEIFLGNRNGEVQYYQPESERLDKGIETFRFAPVIYDYSHILSCDRFGPVTEKSKKLFIWENREHYDGNLILANGRLNNL